MIAAHLPVQRADGEPVGLEQTYQHQSHRAPALASARSSCSPSDVVSTRADAGRARTTTCEPAGRLARRSRIRCRKRRLTRLRSTAPPTALPTTKPTDVGPPAPGTTCVTRVGCTPLAPRRIVCRKSSPLRMRCARESNDSGRQLGAALATTVAKDRAACTGAHAQTETVLLGTTTDVGLKGALAHGCSLWLLNGPIDGHRSPTTIWQFMGMRRVSCRTTRPRYGRPGHGSN